LFVLGFDTLDHGTSRRARYPLSYAEQKAESKAEIKAGLKQQVNGVQFLADVQYFLFS
jgi:hypothetical protein